MIGAMMMIRPVNQINRNQSLSRNRAPLPTLTPISAIGDASKTFAKISSTGDGGGGALYK